MHDLTPTRTPKTCAAYLKTGLRLKRAWGGPNGAWETVIGGFLERLGQLEPPTIRVYRAALKHTIQERLPAELAATHLARLEETLSAHTGPKARRPHGDRCGPALKRRTVPRAQWTAVTDAVTARVPKGRIDDRLLLAWLKLQPSLGLRPVEWTQARLENGVLTVICAKATNGRGPPCGIRVLILTGWSEDDLAELAWALDEFRRRTDAGCASEDIWRPLAARMRRYCENLKIKPFCPYTGRHVAVATDKRGKSPASVSAKAGHITTRTTSTHYARRRSGWDPTEVLGVDADPASIAAVKISPRASRSANLATREARRLAADAIQSIDPVTVTKGEVYAAPDEPSQLPLFQPGQIRAAPIPAPPPQRATTPNPPSTAHPVVRDSASGTRALPGWMTQRPGPMPKPPPGTTAPRARSMPNAAQSPPPSPKVAMPRPAPMPPPPNLKVSLRAAAASPPAAGSALSDSSARSNADPPSPPSAPAPTAGDIPSAPPPVNSAPGVVALDELALGVTPSEPAGAAPLDDDFDLEALLADLPDQSPADMFPILPEILAGQHAHGRPATRSTNVDQAPPYGAHIPTEAETEALYARLREGEKLRLARIAAAEQRHAESNKTTDSDFVCENAPKLDPIAKSP